jgi:hypothetical protein
MFEVTRATTLPREPFAEGGFAGVLAIGAVVLGGAVLVLIAMYVGRAPGGPATSVSSVASASAAATLSSASGSPGSPR